MLLFYYFLNVNFIRNKTTENRKIQLIRRISLSGLNILTLCIQINNHCDI